MKALAYDVVLVAPILVVGAILVDALGHSGHGEEILLFLAFLLGLLFAWHRGKLRSAERLKAIELGRPATGPAPAQERDWTPPRILIAASGWVLFGVLGVLWATSPRALEADALWSSVSILGVTAMVCSTILGWRFLGTRSSRERSPNGDGAGHLAKNAIDPDAFDVVGRRGSESPTFPHHSERRF